MVDKQIIELYWNRSNDAIKETAQKYGKICTCIANNILRDEAEAEVCVNECYTRVWDTIPPHRPQNLKAYVCKITRKHALQMKYPDFMEQDVDLFSAELVIHDFLKGLEIEQRKLFIAHYWYYASVAEIAVKYKMSENKVKTTLDSLRHRLDDALKEKKVFLQSEEECLHAMTEVEDRYLEEVELLQEKDEEINKAVVHIPKENWIKGGIAAVVVVVILVMIAIAMPKSPVEQHPTESEGTSESENSETEIGNMDVDLDNLITIFYGPTMSKEDFAERMEHLLWKKETEVAALPIYKNLAYHSPAGYSVYLDQGTMIARVMAIAEQLNMDVLSMKEDRTMTSDEPQNAIYGIQATTDLGSIQINGRGEVYVSFMNGVKLSNGEEMSDEASVEEANETVSYLLKKYSHLFSLTPWIPNSYAEYNQDGERSMNYQAAGGVYVNEGIPLVEYYFNQVNFEYNEQLGMTGIRYGDIRTAAELVGYYPVISYEEAEALLLQGQYRENDWLYDSTPDTKVEVEDIRGVELMYATSPVDEYYQPYYCFYVESQYTKMYNKCYVPAIKGAGSDGLPPQPEMVIMDLEGYEQCDNFLYWKDGKYFTLVNGELKEENNPSLTDPKEKYGETIDEYAGEYGIVTTFYYGDSEVLNLTQLMKELMPDKKYDELKARYIDGVILVIGIEHRYEDIRPGSHVDYYATHYLFSLEQNSLTQIMEPTPMYRKNNQLLGIVYDGGRYASKRNEDGIVSIVDLKDGSEVATDIRNEDVETIANAGDNHYAVLLKTREIAIIEKESGVLVKKTKAQISFEPSAFLYKDELLYIETYTGGYLLFVISEFES